MIDTRRLRTLRAVADHGTVTAAAAALHLTPSAVSQQLVALEHEVGHRLFTRDGRGVRLTAVGKIMLSHANEVLAQLERAEAEVAAYTTGEAGEVTVACFATAISAVLSPAIAALRATAPGLRVRVLDAEGDHSLALLLDGRADLAITVEYRGAPDATDPRLSRRPLYAEPFDLVLPRDHALAEPLNPALPLDPAPPLAAPTGPAPPLAASIDPAPPLAVSIDPAPPLAASIDPAPPLAVSIDPAPPLAVSIDPAPPLDEPVALVSLAGETWIGPYPGNPVHDMITFACQQAGFTPDLVHCSDDFRAVVALVGAGAGVALVPRLALRDMALPGVVVRRTPGPERRVFAAVRRGSDVHPLLRPLLSALRTVAESLGNG
ncbi:DNA-binding transcriptional regulator, LysR family [Nonomuraea solani]|uniref:DNA-binding transcriptional regulator, LysR family n=1 Tax=Nonomuraea solani TaxID=1144553 RepID=A0A1H6EW68_9ACTN|nr:LysR family transcriptional regulator [Nonomuraea solani]SEH01683.1 DNA-binding transcriptional regulator, LysR family [Nonomuraea solani]